METSAVPVLPARFRIQAVIFLNVVGTRHSMLWVENCLETTGMVRTAYPTGIHCPTLKT